MITKLVLHLRPDMKTEGEKKEKPHTPLTKTRKNYESWSVLRITKKKRNSFELILEKKYGDERGITVLIGKDIVDKFSKIGDELRYFSTVYYKKGSKFWRRTNLNYGWNTY